MDTSAAEAVADLLERIDRAQAHIEAEAAFVLASRAAHLPTPTLPRFLRLVDLVRHAAQARVDLDSLDPETLLADALTLQRRHGPCGAPTARLAAPRAVA